MERAGMAKKNPLFFYCHGLMPLLFPTTTLFASLRANLNLIRKQSKMKHHSLVES